MDEKKRKELLKIYSELETNDAIKEVNSMRRDNKSNHFSADKYLTNARKSSENFRKAMNAVDMDDILCG